MTPVVASSSTQPLAHIPEVAVSECNPPASLSDGSGSLPRSFEESGCPSLDTLLEDTEAADTSDPDTETGQYLCPVYQGGPSSTPGPPVLMVPLPAGPHGADYWVQRRVAMYLCQHWGLTHKLSCMVCCCVLCAAYLVHEVFMLPGPFVLLVLSGSLSGSSGDILYITRFL